MIEDYISSVEARDTDKGLELVATVGDAKITDNPEVKQIKDIKKIVTNLNAAALASN